MFDAVEHDVYAELNQYDVLLLPTRWKGEGVSGALIESKMAGITAIVSDWNINGEVVHNDSEGVVLPVTSAESLADTVIALSKDPERVYVLKKGAFASRKRYCIDTYRQTLIDQVLD